jgi:hypothetical protein
VVVGGSVVVVVELSIVVGGVESSEADEVATAAGVAVGSEAHEAAASDTNARSPKLIRLRAIASIVPLLS